MTWNCGRIEPQAEATSSNTDPMLSVLDNGFRLCDGVTRREWLRIGGIGLGGLSLDQLLGSRSMARPAEAVPAGKAKAVILLGLTGGPSQHDTWDPKPEAPAEVRGPFATIATKTPGLQIGELMPLTARWTHRIGVLRAVVTGDNAHSSSGYQMLTGVPHQPLNRENALPKPPNDAPCLAALVRALRQKPGALPASVVLPEHIWNDGNKPWPGQDAGFLGREYDPWLVHCDPSKQPLHAPSLERPKSVPALRFQRRRRLLDQLSRHVDQLSQSRNMASYSAHQRQAMDLLSGSGARAAFDLSKEPRKLRDRYGRSRWAQSALLARRLVEAGVSLVQINWTRIKGKENQGGWDTHKKHNSSAKNLLMPMMDRAFSALLSDLDDRGLLDETLVVWTGEFGRTPRFNKNAGRDHWGHVFSLAMAGGGIRGGVVHGQSDKRGAFPQSGIVRPRDLAATIFQLLGYHAHTTVADPLGRPVPVSRGKAIAQLT